MCYTDSLIMVNGDQIEKKACFMYFYNLLGRMFVLVIHWSWILYILLPAKNQTLTVWANQFWYHGLYFEIRHVRVV